ncbi:unnamed protein product [Toxocara canis]|uniref:RRM domain-containing protein n=1 Tax=Toxocara canis TaxID=6265 RepID=A0A183UC13_TOXCA|nr:unnamed protein product [Toxocara canis]
MIRKHEKLLLRKRKKRKSLNDNIVGKKSREADFESAEVTSIAATSADEPFDLNKLRAVRYHLNEIYQAKRSLFLKSDASDPHSLIVLNIPPFISAESVKTILEHTVAEGCSLKEVVIKRSMLKNADQNETYRAASASFENEQDVERVLRNSDVRKDVICLSSIGVDILPCGITRKRESEEDAQCTRCGRLDYGYSFS